jgi:hypothetical protein
LAVLHYLELMLRPARARLVLAVAVLLAGAGAAAYFYWPSRAGDPEPSADADGPPPDPRLVFDTPFRNVRPDVQYVGDAAALWSTFQARTE